MSDQIKIENHIAHLEEKHRKVASQVELLESLNALPEDISYFKKKKLRIKDQIEQFKTKIQNMK